MKRIWRVELDIVDTPLKYRGNDDYLSKGEIMGELREFKRTATLGLRVMIRKLALRGKP